jgi:hypothetical protein
MTTGRHCIVSSSVTGIPPFRLDTVNERLWRRSDRQKYEPILSPSKAFAILCQLVEHAGRLQSLDLRT